MLFLLTTFLGYHLLRFIVLGLLAALALALALSFRIRVDVKPGVIVVVNVWRSAAFDVRSADTCVALPSETSWWGGHPLQVSDSARKITATAFVPWGIGATDSDGEVARLRAALDAAGCECRIVERSTTW